MAKPQQRLIELPAAFTAVDALRHFGWNKVYGNKMLSSWVQQGVLERLGPRLDVYVNTARVPQDQRTDALLDALVFGHFRVDPNVWRWYEWSTQISHRREELVVNLTKTLHPRADLILHAKPPGWLRTVAPGLIGSGSYGGPHLHPAWLMAEAVLNPQTTWWSPAPDDIDFDAIHEQNSADSIVYALRALGQYHGRALHLSPTESVESCYTRLWADRHAPEYTRTDPGL